MNCRFDRAEIDCVGEGCVLWSDEERSISERIRSVLSSE